MNKPFIVAAGSGLLSYAGAGDSALTGVICHHSDDVQQASKKFQAEVKYSNSKA